MPAVSTKQRPTASPKQSPAASLDQSPAASLNPSPAASLDQSPAASAKPNPTLVESPWRLPSLIPLSCRALSEIVQTKSQSTATQQPFDDDDFGAITAADLNKIDHLLDRRLADESAATPPVSTERDFGDFTLTDLDGIDLEGQPADKTIRRLTRSEAKRKRQMEAEDDEDDDMPLRPGRRNLRSAQLLRSASPPVSAPPHVVSRRRQRLHRA
jgi:hypothetical protein